jgi:hypothetical protein
LHHPGHSHETFHLKRPGSPGSSDASYGPRNRISVAVRARFKADADFLEQVA